MRRSNMRSFATETTTFVRGDKGQMAVRFAVGAGAVGLVGFGSREILLAQDKSNTDNVSGSGFAVRNYSNISASRLNRYKKSFLHYASVQGLDHKLYLTKEDFLDSIAQNLGELDVDKEKFSKLFDIIFKPDGQKPHFMSFDDYVHFCELLRKPDAEYEIAFKVIDRDGDGKISRDEFKRVICATVDEDSPPFDFNSDWVNIYFPQNQPLSYEQFAQLLKGLPNERIRQEFQFYDKDKNGFISGDDFTKIVRHLKMRNVPPIIKAALASTEKIYNHGSEEKPEYGISYPQLVAFTNLLLHLPSYGRVLKVASEKYKTDKIDKYQFLNVAERTTTVEITPMEVDLIYHFFDLSKDGFLDLTEIERIIESTDLFNKQISKVTAEKKNSPPTSPAAQVPANLTWAQTIIHQAKESGAQFGLGAIAGGIGATAVYPIDLVKTRMQNQRIAIGQTTRLYNNSWDCFRKVFRNEGFFGLYKGLGPQLVGVAPEKAIKLTVNDLLRKLFSTNNSGEIHLPMEILAGGGAGASQVIFTNPLEIVKIRLQTQGELAKANPTASKISAIAHVRELGFTGLYKGAGACLLRDIPFSAMYFPLYAKMKEVLKEEDGSINATSLLVAGAVAGIPAAGLATPADVIKTRLQVKARAGEATYNGIRDCFWKVLEAEGGRAFWKGTVARICRSSPQFGVTLLSYELLQRHLMPSSMRPERPFTTIPVSQSDMESAFKPRKMINKIDRVESSWFRVFEDQKSKNEEDDE